MSLTNPQNWTREQARDFLRSLGIGKYATLTEPERSHMLTIFAMLQPESESNDQRSFTEVYLHAGRTFHVTTFEDGEVVVEEEIQDAVQSHSKTQI